MKNDKTDRLVDLPKGAHITSAGKVTIQKNIVPVLSERKDTGWVMLGYYDKKHRKMEPIPDRMRKYIDPEFKAPWEVETQGKDDQTPSVAPPTAEMKKEESEPTRTPLGASVAPWRPKTTKTYLKQLETLQKAREMNWLVDVPEHAYVTCDDVVMMEARFLPETASAYRAEGECRLGTYDRQTQKMLGINHYNRYYMPREVYEEKVVPIPDQSLAIWRGFYPRRRLAVS